MLCEYEITHNSGLAGCGQRADLEFIARDDAAHESDPELFTTYRCSRPDHAPSSLDYEARKIVHRPFRCMMIFGEA